MKRVCMLSGIALVLMVAGEAIAKNVLVQVTPANIGKQRNAFTVKVTDAGKLKQFEISVRRTPTSNFTPGSPRGELAIKGSKPEAVPMALGAADGQVTFTFRVAPEDLDKAWFTFTENSKGPFPYPGETFTFHLKDFVAAPDSDTKR